MPSTLPPTFGAFPHWRRGFINLGNPILAGRNAAGEPAGVSIDLARAFAEQLGVGCELVVFDKAQASVEPGARKPSRRWLLRHRPAAR